MKILFRTGVGHAIGVGHLRRCLTLAEGLEARGHRCGFLVDQPGAILATAIADRFEVLHSESVRASVRNPIHGEHAGLFDWLVVDDYRLDRRWEATMRTVARRILVIDDLADRPHDCDLLLDQVIFRVAEDYAGLVNRTAELLIGTSYALLRPRFAEVRGQKTPPMDPRAPWKIYVSLGGTDPQERIVGVLKALERLHDVRPSQVHVVISSATERLEQLRAAVSASKLECSLHVDEADVADLMASAHFAVSSGGMTSYELACLGVPSIIVPATQLEADVARDLSRSSDVVVMQGPFDDFEAAIFAELENLTIRMRHGFGLRRPAGALDGRGLGRVMDAIESFRDAEAFDA